MVSIDQALTYIYDQTPTQNRQLQPLELALDHICADEYVTSFANPRFNNSAMDGYGVRLSDKGTCVAVVGEIFAGDETTIDLQAGQVIKITTGARVPSSVEAIVPQEEVEECQGGIMLPHEIAPQSHIRFVGEDVNIGDKIISSGERITPAHIALLASQGISHITTYRPLRAVVLATGEELKLHYQKIEPHQIYNSNAPHLYSRLKELGCEVEFVANIGDNFEAISDAISKGRHADLIITTGGVSVGEKDFVKDAFRTLGGETIFEKINVKPGKPTIFGKLESSYFLGLPGNPLAAASIFELFGTAIVRRLSGVNSYYHGVISTIAAEDISLKKGKATLIPGWFDGQGFTASKKRVPGMVGVLHRCNSYILSTQSTAQITKGERVTIIPFGFRFESSHALQLYSGENI
jgi:molybdopterin molybdotransferase